MGTHIYDRGSITEGIPGGSQSSPPGILPLIEPPSYMCVSGNTEYFCVIEIFFIEEICRLYRKQWVAVVKEH